MQLRDGDPFVALPSDANSWLDVEGSGFPVTTLPLGVVAVEGARFVATRVGDSVVDVTALVDEGLFRDVLNDRQDVFGAPLLNRFLDLGREVWSRFRVRLFELLTDAHAARDERIAAAVHDVGSARLELPIRVGDFTDFNGCVHHTRRLAWLLRGQRDASRSWYDQPLGYHGRAGTVAPSGTAVKRPRGQWLAAGGDDRPRYGPSRALDFEAEVGFVLGPGTALGAPVGIDAAIDHVFGIVLLNDWSARDIQAFELEPLGPFVAKSFMTSISGWVTPLDAVAHRFVAPPVQEPPPADYLRAADHRGITIDLSVEMAAGERGPERIAESNYADMYWTFAQQLAQLTVGGASIRSGDLLGSGTVSGATERAAGSLMELTWNGERPVDVPGGRRSYLEDHDTVVVRGSTTRDDGAPISLGAVVGRVVPSSDASSTSPGADPHRGVRP